MARKKKEEKVLKVVTHPVGEENYKLLEEEDTVDISEAVVEAVEAVEAVNVEAAESAKNLPQTMEEYEEAIKGHPHITDPYEGTIGMVVNPPPTPDDELDEDVRR